MKNIKKGLEPNSLTEYRNSLEVDYSQDSEIARSVFDNFNKKTLREHLLEEQGYICCYCMQRIKNNHHTKIEHFSPVSQYPEKTLDYKNLFVACHGVTSTQDKNHCGIRHCDTSKGDCEHQWVKQKNIDCDLTLNPTDCEKYITGYQHDGTIEYKSIVERDIEEILNLNNDVLKRNRKETIKTVIQELNKKSKKTTWTDAEIDQMIKNYNNKGKEGKYKPYCQVVISFLKKRFKKRLNIK
jgi:uncharacterized protein (TIGR02646 family)